MNDRDMPTLHFSTATLMQRLLRPMQRVLRVACDDLGVVPVIGRAEGSAADDLVHTQESARTEARASARQVASAATEAFARVMRIDIGAPEPLRATMEPLAVPPVAIAGPAERQAAASPPADAVAATTTSRPVTDRVRLRPHRPTRAVAIVASESVTQPTPSPARDPAREKVRIRALPVRARLVPTGAAASSTTPPIEPAAPSSASTAELERATTLSVPVAAARGLVPIVDLPSDPVPRDDTVQLDARHPHPPPGATPRIAASITEPHWTEAPRHTSAFALREHFVLASPPPPAAPSQVPTARAVSLDALRSPGAASFDPSSALSEHALAAVIAAAARRHGIDT